MLRRLWVKAQASSGTAGKVVEVARAGQADQAVSQGSPPVTARA